MESLNSCRERVVTLEKVPLFPFILLPFCLMFVRGLPETLGVYSGCVRKKGGWCRFLLLMWQLSLPGYGGISNLPSWLSVIAKSAFHCLVCAQGAFRSFCVSFLSCHVLSGIFAFNANISALNAWVGGNLLGLPPRRASPMFLILIPRSYSEECISISLRILFQVRSFFFSFNWPSILSFLEAPLILRGVIFSSDPEFSSICAAGCVCATNGSHWFVWFMLQHLEHKRNWSEENHSRPLDSWWVSFLSKNHINSLCKI